MRKLKKNSDIKETFMREDKKVWYTLTGTGKPHVGPVKKKKLDVTGTLKGL